MNTLMAATASVVFGAAATAELQIYTPAAPLVWNEVTFDPRFSNGQGNGFWLADMNAGTTPALTVQQVTTHLLNTVMCKGTPNTVGYKVGGTTFTYAIGDFTFWELRHYPVGSSVSAGDLSQIPATGWMSPGQGFSRTYVVRNPEAPGGTEERTLPTQLTAGFNLFSFNTGMMHPAWADIRWVPQGGTGGHYEITRWAYETSPGIPARVAPLSGCPSDLNGDHDTNVADLSVLLSQFGTSVTPGTSADANGDGVVDTADLSVLFTWFGCNQM